jgi:hypothetical protein
VKCETQQEIKLGYIAIIIAFQLVGGYNL